MVQEATGQGGEVKVEVGWFADAVDKGVAGGLRIGVEAVYSAGRLDCLRFFHEHRKI